MKRRILSILGSAVLLCGVITVSTANVSASERELEQVDGSYLTTEEKSTGYISSPDLRGVHLMDRGIYDIKSRNLPYICVWSNDRKS